MTLKIAVLALALLVAWFIVFRPRRRAGGRPRSARRSTAPPLTALERCPHCGVYRLPDGDCACDPPSTAAR